MRAGRLVIDAIEMGYASGLVNPGWQGVREFIVNNELLPYVPSQQQCQSWDFEARKLSARIKGDGRVAVTMPVASTGYRRSSIALPDEQYATTVERAKADATRITNDALIATSHANRPGATRKQVELAIRLQATANSARAAVGLELVTFPTNPNQLFDVNGIG